MTTQKHLYSQDDALKQPVVRKYKHKDHPKCHPVTWERMLALMGQSRRDQMVWAIFEVLTPEQKAGVLAYFGWTQVE